MGIVRFFLDVAQFAQALQNVCEKSCMCSQAIRKHLANFAQNRKMFAHSVESAEFSHNLKNMQNVRRYWRTIENLCKTRKNSADVSQLILQKQHLNNASSHETGYGRIGLGALVHVPTRSSSA